MLNSMFNVGENRFISVFLCLCLSACILRTKERAICVCVFTPSGACVLTSCGELGVELIRGVHGPIFMTPTGASNKEITISSERGLPEHSPESIRII